MKRTAVFFLLALLGCVTAPNAPPAAATEISFDSRTYVPVRGIDGEDTHLLFYEYLSLDAHDFVKPGVYLRLGGWGRADLADETLGRKSNGELQYGFIGWRGPQSNAEGRLGRLSLTAGAARNEVFDGALLGTDLAAGFDVTLFGGVPVETDNDGRSGDLLYGARVSQGRAGRYRVGVSYLKEENDGDAAREEACADVFLAPANLVEVSGSSRYDLDDEGWARHDYRLDLGPFARSVRLAATFASTDYRHFFRGSTNAAFGEIDPQERLDRIGGEVGVDLGRGLRLTGEFVSYAYDLAESAQAWGGHLDWAGSRRTAGVGYRKLDGDEAENRYWLLRGYASAPVGPLAVAAGVEHVTYDQEINGKKDATTGTLTLGYAATKALDISASAEYGVTPDFERQVSFLFAVLWRYDASTKKGGRP